MRKLLLILLALAVYGIPAANAQQAGRGNLFIIGGGTREDTLMRHMVAVAGLQKKDYVVVLPMASEIPDTGFKYINAQLHAIAPNKITMLDFRKPALTVMRGDGKVMTPVTDRRVDSVRRAKLIYILGGDQNRFMQAVTGTPVYDAIHYAYEHGATIAGTSAGAAVMSELMITGRQLREKNYKETFDRIYTDNIEFARGMGLLQHTIVDQHFIKRSRFNRLISALLTKGPDYDCVGIDEGTAIIVHDGKATVAGVGQVLKFSYPERVGSSRAGAFQFKDLKISAYTAGDTFAIKP